ncbi:MAG: carboxy terminal-processing peptidase [Thermoguttaceae bacterium]|nr:carboxy terminal-processing peptidase [Thermoguttaceae bacterium]
MFCKIRMISLLFAMVLLTTACQKAVSDNATPGELKPAARDQLIARSFCQSLELKHVSRHPVDKMISERAFGLYLKSIDPMKIYLTKDDVLRFEALYKEKLGEMARSGDVSPAFAIYRLFMQRVDERCKMAHEILDSPLEFETDEYYLRDKDKLDWSATDQELRNRMRQEIKYKILDLEGDKRESLREETNKKATANGDNAPAAKKQTDRSNEPPIQKLHRRYTSLQKRIHQITSDDILELYLTAIANSYDPHSTFMSPKTFDNFIIQMRLNLDGIGATLGWEDGYTIVRNLVKGGAADKQGELQPEDRIISVGQGNEGEFEDVVDMSLSDVVTKIRGKRGTTVRLEVLPASGKSKKVITIVREKIELEDSAAQSKIFEVGKKADGTPWRVGVIDLPSFYFDMEARSKGDSSGRSTTQDVRKILRQFVAEKVDACVVDLRFNGGGSLQEVIDLTGLFIKTGCVVQVKPSEYDANHAKSLDDRDPGIEWGGPLVVMTSKFSASASEIFAGAIKDYKRGIIVGDETTHGKGTVQPLINIGQLIFGMFSKSPNYGTLKVSIQGFYLPDGQSTQLVGVKSDIQLPSLTNYFEGAEADSDYPLSFEKIAPAASWPVFNYVSDDILKVLRDQSAARIAQSKDFAKVNKKIEVYTEFKKAKKTPLNREKYFAQLDRLNTDKEEKGEYERLLGVDQKIIKDYYMDEVLGITADYLNILREKQIPFQKEVSNVEKPFIW